MDGELEVAPAHVIPGPLHQPEPWEHGGSAGGGDSGNQSQGRSVDVDGLATAGRLRL